MRYSIIMPCRNEVQAIGTVLSSLLVQVRQLGDGEILVADGASTDGTLVLVDALAAHAPEVRLVDNPRQIASTGLNAALAVAQGGVILRCDAHTTYAPDYVAQCLAVLAETDADNVGGPWVAVGQGWLGRAIAAAHQSPWACGGARSHDPTYEGWVDSVYLGCWHRETLVQLGGFDEALVRNQDDELNLRLARAGGRLWQSPRIRSWYTPRAALRALWRQYFQYGFWKVAVLRKHRRPAALRHLVPAAWLSLLAGLALLGLLWTPAWWVLLALVGLYSGGLLIAAVLTARHAGWDLLPLLPLCMACIHLAYGSGFLVGLIAVTRGAAGGARPSPAPDIAATPPMPTAPDSTP